MDKAVHYPERSLMVRCILVLLLLIVGITLYNVGIVHCLSADWLTENRASLASFVGSYPLKAHVLYTLIYTIARALAIPGSLAFVTAGAMFLGQQSAFFCGLVAITIGSTISFLISRYLLGEYIQRRYHHRLQGFNQDLDRHGFYYLLALRWIGIMPTFLINLFTGLSTISVGVFAQTTVLGSIPTVFFFSYLGHKLGCVTSLASLWYSGAVMPLAFFIAYKLVVIPLVVWGVKKRRSAA